LKEKSRNAAAKVAFSITMEKERKRGAKYIYYLNEMWINQNHTQKGCWRMNDVSSIQLPNNVRVWY
jgi:hypothetical protein